MRCSGLRGWRGLRGGNSPAKVLDKAVEHRILEAIPNELADQICVGLKGAETKAELLAKRAVDLNIFTE